MAHGVPRHGPQRLPDGPSLCKAMSVSGWDEERIKEDTDTSLGSLLPLETFRGAGSCGVLQECASPPQGMLHTSALLRLSCLLTSGHRGWSQTTWEKSHQNRCQITQRRTQKQVFLELVPDRGEIQVGRFKSEWFTFPGFRCFNLQL